MPDPVVSLYAPVLRRIASLLQGGKPVLVAIDGRCGSGKTRLAEHIAGAFPCNVFHTDDFYLPVPARQAGWSQIPGGNMDFERLRSTVLRAVRAGEPVVYRAYSCRDGTLRPPVVLPPRQLNLVEGGYSHHPLLDGQYDWKLFLTCSKQAQAHRIRRREGDGCASFWETWIPLEERYFQSCAVEQNAGMTLDTTDLF